MSVMYGGMLYVRDTINARGYVGEMSYIVCRESYVVCRVTCDVQG